MNKRSPAISVIMPVYNAEMYLKDSIESILDQSFTDFEFLIYNDGSTDKTDEIINTFKDVRIVYKKMDKNSGYLNLLNDGLAIAKGKYIARMDADDISMPNRFEEQYKYLENNAEVGICGSWIEFIGEQSGVIERPVSFEEIQFGLFFSCPLTHPTVMMRNDLLKKYNLIYHTEYYYAEDHYFFAQASLHFKIVNLPKVLLKYRIHSSQIGSARWKEQFFAKSAIQANLFSNILLKKNDEDLKWLKTFFREQSVPDEKWLNDIESYEERIIKDNEVNPVYPPSILNRAVNKIFKSKTERNFYNYFFSKYYNQKTFSPALLGSFLKEKYKPYRFLGKQMTSYFVLKCLIGFRKKTVLCN